MKYALKEWSTTAEALGKGLVTAIWRKGGIDDNPSIRAKYESFEIKHTNFVFFPTYTHENLEKIKREFYFLYEQSNSVRKEIDIRIKYWAEIHEEIAVEKIDQLLNLSNELVNSTEHLVSSWNLHPSHSGKLIILRVYKLANPIIIPNSEEYKGCKSWVEIKADIPRAGSEAVLPYKEFNRKVRLIKELLKAEPESIPILPEIIEEEIFKERP